MVPEGFEISFPDLSGRPDDSFRVGEIRSKRFSNRERVHPIEEVTAHQAVSAATIYIHATAAGHDNLHLITVGVEESLEKLFPARI